MIPLYLNFLRHIEEKVLAKILRNPPKRFLSTGPLEKGPFLFEQHSSMNSLMLSKNWAQRLYGELRLHTCNVV